MNRILLILISYSVSHCAPGCMDNSYHLNRMFDYKNYHYVACNCPCQKQYKILANRGQCSKCLHYRDPRHAAVTETALIFPLRRKQIPDHCYPVEHAQAVNED